jgi:hypothetical protein
MAGGAVGQIGPVDYGSAFFMTAQATFVQRVEVCRGGGDLPRFKLVFFMTILAAYEYTCARVRTKMTFLARDVAVQNCGVKVVVENANRLVGVGMAFAARTKLIAW